MRTIFLMENKDILLICLIAVAVLAIVIILYAVFAGHLHAKRAVSDATKKYDSVHNLLTIQMNQELKRVGSIAQANAEYEKVYNRNYSLFQDILRQEDAAAKESVTYINKLIADKKYKLLKEELEITRKRIAALEEKYSQLNHSLDDIVSVDEENRQEILRYRRQFRDIREAYEEKKGELKFIDSSFTSVFDKLEAAFINSEKLLSGAHYDESKENFPEIQKVLNALEKAIQTLPKLVTLSYVVLPASVDEMMKQYEELCEQKYPLHHLRVQAAADDFRGRLEEIHAKLVRFQSKNVDVELNQIRDAIIKLTNDFDREVRSKEYFVQNFETVYNGSYRLENRFIKLKRLIPDYKKTYLLRDTCLDQLDKIQSDINQLGTIKRTLDTYIHASSQQPYSTLAQRLEELSDAMTEIDEGIQTVHEYLSSLKKDTEGGYSYITDTYLALKKVESRVRQINVPNLTAAMKAQLNQCYASLNQAGEILQQLPIDVDTLNRVLNEVKKNADTIFRSVENLEESARKAEDSIVYANQYREEFYDVQTSLKHAEKLFADGNFKGTFEETSGIIHKFSSK